MTRPRLEEFALKLREALEIQPEVILNEEHFEELCEKIPEVFPNYEIKLWDDEISRLELKNEDNFTIWIGGPAKNLIYKLVEIFTFAISLNKKDLTGHQLEYSYFDFPRFRKDNGISEYLMLAFMMPKKAFLSTLCKYTSADGSTARLTQMQEEVNQYCYKRGCDLGIW